MVIKSGNEILIKSAQIISTLGLENYSMQKLASELGINKASLYHYYKSKEAIIDAMHEYYHGLGDLINALAGAGFTLNSIREYPYANGWEPFADMRHGEGEHARRRYPPARRKGRPFPSLPLMFSLDAKKST